MVASKKRASKKTSDQKRKYGYGTKVYKSRVVYRDAPKKKRRSSANGSVRSTKHGMLVSHKEYVGDIRSGPTAGLFDVKSIAINPGNLPTFPWLARIARSFDQYKIRKMKFEYKTMSSDALNSTNTSLGTIIIAANYNVLAPAFTSKHEMENYEGAVSTKPSADVEFRVEANPHSMPVQELFVRVDGDPNPPAGNDLRLYDLGNLSVATVGGQAPNVNLGELWVSYEVELIKPKLRTLPTIGSDIGSGGGTDVNVNIDLLAEGQFAWYHIDNSADSTTGIFGNARRAANSNLDVTAQGNSITFADHLKGAFMITIVMNGTGRITSLGANVVQPLELINGLAGHSSVIVPNEAGLFHLTATVRTLTGGGSIFLNRGEFPTNRTGGDLWITRITHERTSYGNDHTRLPEIDEIEELAAGNLPLTCPIPQAPAPLKVVKVSNFKLPRTDGMLFKGATPGLFTNQVDVLFGPNGQSITFPDDFSATVFGCIAMTSPYGGNVSGLSVSYTGGATPYKGLSGVDGIAISNTSGVFQQTFMFSCNNGGTVSLNGGNLPNYTDTGDLWLMVVQL